MNKIRVTMCNNSDARRVNGTLLGGCPARHNGGKVVIIEAADITRACEALDDDNRVASYVVQALETE